MTAVDVVVVSYNSREVLRRCVEPLSREDWINVIVVDNASPDDSLTAIQDLPVTAIQLETNAGFAHGCNTGWRHGKSPHVLFLNPDARIEPASVRRLAEALEGDGAIGIAGPRIVNERGELEFSVRRFPRLKSTYAQALFLHRVWRGAEWTDEVIRRPERYEAAADVEWLSGACMMVRRSVLEQVSGFDERFFMYCEDKDLCRRAWANGMRVCFEPDAVAVHVGGGGASAPRGDLLPVLASSRIRYAQKHNTGAVAAIEQVGVAVGSLTHAAVGRGDSGARRGHARAFVTAIKAS